MWAFFFHNWQKPVGVLITVLMLVVLFIQPVTAADSSQPWLKLDADLYLRYVCPNRQVSLEYSLKFDKVEFDKANLAPIEPLTPQGQIPKGPEGPKVTVKSVSGNVIYASKLEAKDYPFYSFWHETVKFTPKKNGDATVTITVSYRGASVTDTWDIEVKPCKYDIEINADQSGIKHSSGQTFNEVQHDVQFVIFLKGLANGVMVDNLMGEGGSGGNQRLANAALPSSNMEDATGKMEFFGDAIWLGGDHSDFVCGTRGAMTANREFTVNPIPGEESIEFMIDVASGMSSSFTAWCEGEGGGGENTIPPTASKPYAINVIIPWEGGTSHYIDHLPYGITVDYLVSAFPVEEE